MWNQLRSSAGCWTCKLRKKKCGEERPACLVCKSLTLDCSGYGSRPDWMDSESKKKEVLARIQKTVKEVTGQKKKIAMQNRRKIIPVQAVQQPSIGSRLPQQLRTPFTSQETHLILPVKPLSLSRIESAPSFHQEDVAAYVAQNEPILLMHYLDNVFPCQFRFYQATLDEGGRGWLLSLLMQTKPLYYTACSLAAYHRQMMYYFSGRMLKPCFTNEALHLQYDIAVTALRKYLEELGSTDHERTLMEDVQLLSSMVLLVSTEAFISSSKSWHMHLTAAITLLPEVCRKLRDAISNGHVSPSFRAGLSFFVSVGLWYDILSCATTRLKPFNLDTTKLNDYIRFDKVMGCENWAMFAIKDTATIDHWKNTSKATGQLSVRELVTRGNAIEARLKAGLEENLRALQQMKTSMAAGDQDTLGEQKYRIAYVTRIYGYACLVYLHVIVSGPWPNLPEINSAIADAIEAFKNLPPKGLLNSLIWPLCIIGCMANEKNQEFFSSLALPTTPSDTIFGPAKARAIFEECWRLRRLEPNSGTVDWRVAMESLKFKILLK